MGPFSSAMTSAEQLLPDPAPRKLDRMMEELRTPTAIGYSVRRGQSSKEGLKAQRSKSLA
jgi:hypothetical protein